MPKGKPHYAIYIETEYMGYYNGNGMGRKSIRKINDKYATKFGTNSGKVVVLNNNQKITITDEDIKIENE